MSAIHLIPVARLLVKEVVLVDQYCTGHHLSYLRIYASIMIELGYDVVVLCSDTDLVSRYLFDLISDKKNKIRVLKILDIKKQNVKVNKIKNGLIRDVMESRQAYLRFLLIEKTLQVHKISRASLVVFMWLDDYISKLFPGFALDRFFLNKWGGIYFHPSRIKYDETSSRCFRDVLHRVPVFGSSRLMFVGLFDASMIGRLQQKNSRCNFQWLPDVAEKYPPDLASATIRKVLDLARGRKIVALLGSLGKRKNVISFFEAVERCTNENVFFLCSGQLQKGDYSKDELEFISQIAVRFRDKLYYDEEYIGSDVVFDTLFHISDILVAVYDRFPSSSNLITKAALHKKNIIVSNEYLMGEVVAEYGLGLLVNSGSAEDLLCAINNILCKSEDVQGRFSDYLDKYSLDNLKGRLKDILLNKA